MRNKMFLKSNTVGTSRSVSFESVFRMGFQGKSQYRQKISRMTSIIFIFEYLKETGWFWFPVSLKLAYQTFYWIVFEKLVKKQQKCRESLIKESALLDCSILKPYFWKLYRFLMLWRMSWAVAVIGNQTVL